MSFARVFDRLSSCALRSRLARWLLALILFVGLEGAVVGGAWAGPMFSAALSFEVGGAPSSVAIGDVSGDGNPGTRSETAGTCRLLSKILHQLL